MCSLQQSYRVTPLGLPVFQPYYNYKPFVINGNLQSLTLRKPSKTLPVNRREQESAFPPNYIHSLDSTHMMMTANDCVKNHLIDFAAVHDSYWTHACDIDILHSSIRQQFYNLHSQPILTQLHESFSRRFPELPFPSLPAIGKLDLKQVFDSPYFFH